MMYVDVDVFYVVFLAVLWGTDYSGLEFTPFFDAFFRDLGNIKLCGADFMFNGSIKIKEAQAWAKQGWECRNCG